MGPTRLKRYYRGPHLNPRDLIVMHYRQDCQMNVKETAEKIGFSESTVNRIEKKQAYRDKLIADLQQRGYDTGTYADNMIALTQAEKTMNIKGQEVKAPENIVRFNANSELGEVFGIKAPKEFDLKHTLLAMSDDDLSKAIDDSTENLIDGQIEHRLTGTPHAESVITHQKAEKQPCLVEEFGQQENRPAVD